MRTYKNNSEGLHEAKSKISAKTFSPKVKRSLEVIEEIKTYCAANLVFTNPVPLFQTLETLKLGLIVDYENLLEHVKAIHEADIAGYINGLVSSVADVQVNFGESNDSELSALKEKIAADLK